MAIDLHRRVRAPPQVLLPQPSFYLVCLLTTVVALVPDAVFRGLQRVYFPQDHHIVQEIALLQAEERKSTERHSAVRSSRTAPSAYMPEDAADTQSSSVRKLPASERAREERHCSPSMLATEAE